MSVVVLLGLGAFDRLALFHRLKHADDAGDDGGDAGFALRREDAPSGGSKSDAMQMMLKEGVSVEVASGSVLVRVRGLSPADAERLAACDMAGLSADPEWRLWLERSHVAAKAHSVPIDDVFFVAAASLSSSSSVACQEMEYRFVPVEQTDADWRLLARHLVAAMRGADFVVWFADSGSVFRTAAFSGEVAKAYTKLLSKMAGMFEPAGERVFKYSGQAGFFVFSQAGLVGIGEQFVKQVLQICGPRPGDVDVAQSSMLCFRPPDTIKENVADLAAIRFIDGHGCDFAREEHEGAGRWGVLCDALRRAENVRWLSLSGCRLTDDQVSELIGLVRARRELETVLLGVALWRRLVDSGRIEVSSQFVPSHVASDVSFASEAARQEPPAMSEFDEEAILNMSDFDQGAVGATTTFAAPTSASSASSATTAAAATSGTGTDVELDNMKAKLAEMEAEAAKLREIQAKVEKDLSTQSVASKADSDARSVFVGNVDFSSTPEELQQHFQSCGTILRITIMCDKFTGKPKGHAYVEFAEASSVASAMLMNDSLFKGRQLKVTSKRTNVPVWQLPRGGGGGGGGGGRGAPRGGYRGRGGAPRGFRARGGRFRPY